MRLTAMWIAAATAALALTGCDENNASSGKGESCLTTADCKGELSCVENVCVDGKSGSGVEGSACVSHADCEMDLICAGNVCRANETSLVGGLGASCASSTDCRADLTCVRGSCLERDVHLSASGKECAIIECKANADCCDEPSAECTDLKQACKDGDRSACFEYDYGRCGCDYACKGNLCVNANACRRNADCRSGTPYCRSGACAECKKQEHCPDGYACKAGTCEKPCEKDNECGALQACKKGDCVDVGCKSDRQCANLLKAAWAVCVDGACGAPCEYDAECLAIEGSTSVCEGGVCVPLGCTANDQCQGYMGLPSYYSPRDFPNAYAVCQ